MVGSNRRYFTHSPENCHAFRNTTTTERGTLFRAAGLPLPAGGLLRCLRGQWVHFTLSYFHTTPFLKEIPDARCIYDS